jgi:hypothetical protein
MTLRLIEGFDHFNSQALAAVKGWQLQGNGITTMAFGSGRINGGAMTLSATSFGADAHVVKFLPSTATIAVFGFAVKPSSLPFAQIGDLLDNSGSTIVSIGLDAGGRLTLLNGPLLTLIATGTTVFPTGAWFYVEVKATVNGASGSVEAQVNGVAEIGSTTVNIGTAPIGAVSLHYQGPGVSNSSIGFDDIIVCDSSGGENNDFLGDRHVETLYPNGAGAHTGWTPDSGSNYARLNEHAPDGDTSYVASDTASTIDTYAFDDLSIPTADIRGIQVNLWARKFDASLRKIAPVVRPGSTDHVGTDQTLSTSYVDGTQIYEQNPDTSSDWTVSDINASEFGMEVTA